MGLARVWFPKVRTGRNLVHKYPNIPKASSSMTRNLRTLQSCTRIRRSLPKSWVRDPNLSNQPSVSRRDSDPTRPESNVIRIQHWIQIVEKRIWTRTTAVVRERRPMSISIFWRVTVANFDFLASPFWRISSSAESRNIFTHTNRQVRKVIIFIGRFVGKKWTTDKRNPA